MKADKAERRERKRQKRKNGMRMDNQSMKNVEIQRAQDIRANRRLRNILTGEKDNG